MATPDEKDHKTAPELEFGGDALPQDPSPDYTMVWDEAEVQRFAQLFLHEKADHVQMVMLFARRKYDDNLPSSNAMLARHIVRTADPKRFLERVLRLQTPQGSYGMNTDKNAAPHPPADSDDSDDALASPSPRYPVHPKALVAYLLLNPRNVVSGVTNYRKQLDLWFEARALGHADPFDLRKSDTALFSCIHKAQRVKLFVELDVDTKDPAVWGDVCHFLMLSEHSSSWNVHATVETRGGYHVVLDATNLNKQARTVLYKHFNAPKFAFEELNFVGKTVRKKFVDIRSDPCPPIAGTVQGGFRVRLMGNDELLLAAKAYASTPTTEA